VDLFDHGSCDDHARLVWDGLPFIQIGGGKRLRQRDAVALGTKRKEVTTEDSPMLMLCPNIGILGA
jgi:hypothetical protein